METGDLLTDEELERLMACLRGETTAEQRLDARRARAADGVFDTSPKRSGPAPKERA